jgi:hypothetical protein
MLCGSVLDVAYIATYPVATGCRRPAGGRRSRRGAAVPTEPDEQQPLACPRCATLVEPVTSVAFDLRLRAVTVTRARCPGCGWERTTGPERRPGAAPDDPVSPAPPARPGRHP